MFQNGTLGGLSLAAGLWLTASASLAAPQPGQMMPLGASALPPAGYVAFCMRRPVDCGDDAGLVLVGALQAQTERTALFAVADPTALTSLRFGAPAALGRLNQLPHRATEAPLPVDAVAPAPEPLSAVTERAETATSVAFVDPAGRVRGGGLAHTMTEQAALPMTPSLWTRLNIVNGQVNHAIVQRTDLETYGRPDYWTTPIEDGIGYGDCEDYVLEKQRALAAAGVPRRSLNIALVTTPWGESHAVLVVSTSDVDFVLDNLTPWIMPWQKTGYRWRQRQVNGQPFTWAMVEDSPRPQSQTPAPERRLPIGVLR